MTTTNNKANRFDEAFELELSKFARRKFAEVKDPPLNRVQVIEGQMGQFAYYVEIIKVEHGEDHVLYGFSMYAVTRKYRGPKSRNRLVKFWQDGRVEY